MPLYTRASDDGRASAPRRRRRVKRPGRRRRLRIAVLDRDSGFIQVLSKRLDRLGWEHRVLAGPVPTDAIASMRLSALVVDLTVLGPQAWEWLERLCGALPELGIVVCTGPRPSPSACAGCDWAPMTGSPSPVTPRRSSPACRARRVAAGARSRAHRVKARAAPARSRSAPTASRRSWPAAASS